MDNNLVEAIRMACAEIGTTSPLSVIADGKIHRYHDPANDKPFESSAWYKACDNVGSYGGTVGHWRIGIKRNWSSRSHKEFTQAERLGYAKRMAEARDKQDQERQQRQAEARTRAETLIGESQTANPRHLYLLKKGVGIYGIRQHGDSLVIPLRNAEGVLTSLQFIKPDGSKKFLSGGEITGSYHVMGDTPTDNVLIAEGYATAATIYEAIDQPTACAFNAGNLKPVALAIHRKFPTVHIIVAADADPVGIRSAEAAASAVGGSVVIPDFGGDV